MTYTDKQFYFAIANATPDQLRPLFTDPQAAIEKASRKLQTLNNRKRSPRKYTSKRPANVNLFNEKVLPYLEQAKFATAADIRSHALPDCSPSKVTAVLNAAHAEGLVSRRTMWPYNDQGIRSATYYTVPGYEFEKKPVAA